MGVDANLVLKDMYLKLKARRRDEDLASWSF
jgi:hypothetical protein